jgi:1,5-anhydro-D-fructose reductase (1,5-anhydro-D-mannitol-forming)
MDRVNWLLVGTGDITQKRVAAALAGAEGSRLVAVCGRQRERVQSLADRFGAGEIFTDFTEALTKASAEAVYLATPVWLHTAQAIEALNAGKHVLIEKPLGLNATDGSRVIAAAEKSGKFASCAYYRRFYPRYAYTKSMLDNLEFGRILSVQMTYMAWFNPAPGDPKFWRVVKAESGGGPLCDMGSHMFDVMIGLFGLPETVYAQCANLVHRWDVEDSAVVTMRLRGGGLAQSRIYWNARTWQHEFEIVGTEARIQWSPYDNGPVIKTVGSRSEKVDLPSAENVHLPLVQDFVKGILTNRGPQASVVEACQANLLLDAIYQSACSGQEVKVT